MSETRETLFDGRNLATDCDCAHTRCSVHDHLLGVTATQLLDELDRLAWAGKLVSGGVLFDLGDATDIQIIVSKMRARLLRV